MLTYYNEIDPQKAAGTTAGLRRWNRCPSGASLHRGIPEFMKQTPKELDLISDVVLNYKPKEKAKASKRREKKRAKRDAKKG